MASLDYCTVHEPLICTIRIRAPVPLCFSGATLLQTCQRLLPTLWQTRYRGPEGTGNPYGKFVMRYQRAWSAFDLFLRG